MVTKVVNYFKTGPDEPLLEDPNQIRKIYEFKRWSVFISLVIGYGFFYTCRLSLSVAKKHMIDAGVVDVNQLGIIGAVLLYVYAFGKFFNGFLADRANIRRFMSTALLLSAVVNLIFGFTTYFMLFVVLRSLFFFKDKVLMLFEQWLDKAINSVHITDLCQTSLMEMDQTLSCNSILVKKCYLGGILGKLG